MKIKDQVTSPAVSKRLAGYLGEQETAFVWSDGDLYFRVRNNLFHKVGTTFPAVSLGKYDPAPTLSELLALLPVSIDGYYLNMNLMRYEKEIYRAYLRGYVMQSCKNMRSFKKGSERLTVEITAELVIWCVDEVTK
jgi:hypothetical protein